MKVMAPNKIKLNGNAFFINGGGGTGVASILCEARKKKKKKTKKKIQDRLPDIVHTVNHLRMCKVT